MLWVMNASFFLNLYPGFSKKDIYKCPFFKKGPWELKFSYIITLSASALPFFAGLPFCSYLLFILFKIYSIMVWIKDRRLFAKDGVKFGEHLFHKTRMGGFGGCFEYSPRWKFNLCPKNGGSCFDPFFSFFLPFFWGSFVFLFWRVL